MILCTLHLELERSLTQEVVGTKKKGKGKEEGGGEKEREEGERGVGGDCEVKEERGRERWDEKMK